MLVSTRLDRADDPSLDAAQRQITLREIVDHRLVTPSGDGARNSALTREKFQERDPTLAGPRAIRTRELLSAFHVGGVTRVYPPLLCDTTYLSRGARSLPVV